MLHKITYSVFVCIFCWNLSQGQEPETDQKKDKKRKEKVESQTIDPLSPSRAAFYSAVLPGLGQAYNKKYWKIPIVYAALGTGMYFVVDNQKNYDRYQDAYKLRISGRPDEFDGTGSIPYICNDGLIWAQDIF